MASVLRSIFGRLVGLDKDNYLTGDLAGIKVQDVYIGDAGSETQLQIRDETTVTAYSTANGGAIATRGIATLSSASTDYTLANPPAAGIRKVITTLTTSTLVRTITRASTASYFQSTEGATMVKITMAQGGASVTLQSLSTAIWAVIGRTSTDTALSGTS